MSHKHETRDAVLHLLAWIRGEHPPYKQDVKTTYYAAAEERGAVLVVARGRHAERLRALVSEWGGLPQVTTPEPTTTERTT